MVTNYVGDERSGYLGGRMIKFCMILYEYVVFASKDGRGSTKAHY